MRDQSEIHINEGKLREFILSSDAQTQAWALEKLGGMWATFGVGSMDATDELVKVACCGKHDPSRSFARILLNRYADHEENQKRVAKAFYKITKSALTPDNVVHATVASIGFLLEQKSSHEMRDSSLRVLGKALLMEGTPSPVKAAVLHVMHNMLDKGTDISAIRPCLEKISRSRNDEYMADAQKIIFKANLLDWNRPERKVVYLKPLRETARAAAAVIPRKVASAFML